MKVVELSGGVGGARLAVGLERVPGIDLTVVVNVGDDEVFHGLHVSADIDTVLYTMAGIQGELGWGRNDDSFVVNKELERFGRDNRFQLGDLDIALNLTRTAMLSEGSTLAETTAHLAKHLGIEATVAPATNDRVRTEVSVPNIGWMSFQEYFVLRQNQDTVDAVRFAGADLATPTPGVTEAINQADAVLIAPSNPPLSVWPILAIPQIRSEIASHPNVVAVSPLFGGKALKGPADRVMASLGLPPGNMGVEAAYDGLINKLIVDDGDADDIELLATPAVAMDTRIGDPESSASFVANLLQS